MQLKVQIKGNAEPFLNYLENFAKIKSSLLLEIDVEKNMFIAKTFTEDKAAVRYSAISFEECNLSVVKHDNTGENVTRIKLGIIGALPKFIRMCELCCGSKDNADFMINFNYSALNDQKTGAVDYVVTSSTVSSERLTMKQDGFRTTELFYLSDETFMNNVFHAVRTVTFDISAADINSIIKTSELTQIDPRKDGLIFYTEGKSVFVSDDPQSGSVPNFVMKIAELEEVPMDPVKVPIFRQKFIQIVGKSNEAYTAIIGYTKNHVNDSTAGRVLLDSKTTQTKIVISGINRANN